MVLHKTANSEENLSVQPTNGDAAPFYSSGGRCSEFLFGWCTRVQPLPEDPGHPNGAGHSSGPIPVR